MTYEFEGKTEKDAIENAARDLGLEKDQFDVEILETQKNTLFKKGFVKIRVHVEKSQANTQSSDMIQDHKKIITDVIPQNEFETKIVDFVKTMITKMGYEVKVEVMFREEAKIGIKLESSNSSILIGRKGKNLDAMQLLTNVFAGRLGYENFRIILDIENYRIRREESLVRLAYNTADKVQMKKRSILLEPMNPFERRLIHTTLNDLPDIETKSEGDGLYKQVRVIYKGGIH